MYLKRIFDVILALFGIISLTPLILTIAVLIKLTMPGPVFFRHARVGKHARHFTMIKFRTMTVDPGGSSVTVKGENRITTFGEFLRKSKLDELPTLFHVLSGKMSLVGPRPDVPGYADQLQGEDRKILELRPGITGPATLKYAREEELLSRQEDPQAYNDNVIYPDKVRLNLEYYYHHNLWLDLKIILKTLFRKY